MEQYGSDSTQNAAVEINTTGNVTINNVKIFNNGHRAITNKSFLNIEENCEINGTAKGRSTIFNEIEGNLKITGGKITATQDDSISNRGKVEISGTALIEGKGTAPTIFNDGGTIKISGGTTTSTEGTTLNNKNSGKIEISGGTIVGATSAKAATVYNFENSEIKITGGKITATMEDTISNKGYVEISGTALIEGTSLVPTIYNVAGATLNMSGGTVTATIGTAIRNLASGNVTITGGTISSTELYAINNSGNCSVTNATIKGNTYGV